MLRTLNTNRENNERNEEEVFSFGVYVSLPHVYTAVFSVVGGALRDDTKNGCVAD